MGNTLHLSNETLDAILATAGLHPPKPKSSPNADGTADPAPDAEATTTDKPDRRAQTSPINGAKSQGPTSESGKARSSQNALRHGITSKHPVLATESHEEYAQLRQTYLDLWDPQTPPEQDLVEDLIDARWRLRRIKRHEQKLLNLEMARALNEDAEAFDALDAGTLEALAFQRASYDRSLENIDRYERRYDRIYHRSLEKLQKLHREKQTSGTSPAPETAPIEPNLEAAEAPHQPEPPPTPAPEPHRSRWLSWLLPILLALVALRQAKASPHARLATISSGVVVPLPHMHREYHKWFSPTLGRDMELLRFGHAGAPVLVFPTSMGRFFEFEDRGMTHALAHKLDAGHLQAFCVDSVDTESWYNRHTHPANRVLRHIQYEEYLLREVLPLIAHHSGGQRLAVTGASFGGYHCVNFALRHPHYISRCVSMSGAFDIRSFLHGYYDQNAYFHNPVDFIPQLTDHAVLSQIRNMQIILGTSDWDICLPDNQRLSGSLLDKAIPHWLDIWGDHSKHDWPLWQRMLAKYF